MFTVIGTANVDLLIDAPERPLREGDEFTTGSLVFCDTPLRTILGGNGANSAYALARLGVPVQLCSAVGRDALGDLVDGWLTNAGVETSTLVRSRNAATASTTIITDTTHNRIAYHHRGALGTYGPDDLPPTVLEATGGVLLTSYPLLPGWDPPSVVRLFASLKRRSIFTALDIGPAIAPLARLHDLEDALPSVDYLLCNEHELCAFTRAKDVEDAAARVLRAGLRHLVLKRGPAGATLYRASNDEPLHVPAYAVSVRSTVGAGDAFNAGFLSGIHHGWPLTRAVRLGHAVAALVVSSPDGVLSSPTLREAEAFLRQPQRTR